MLSDERCTAKTINAMQLDDAVWTKVTEVLKNPRTVLAGLQQLNNGAHQDSFFEEELDRLTKDIEKVNTEQQQLLQWALKGFPDVIVVKENERLNRQRIELQREIEETEKKLEQARERHIDPEKLEEFCRIASQNISAFGYAEKKLTLETLRVRVSIDDKMPRLEGILPIPSEACATSQHS